MKMNKGEIENSWVTQTEREREMGEGVYMYSLYINEQ
jgi:hypothetical protein